MKPRQGTLFKVRTPPRTGTPDRTIPDWLRRQIETANPNAFGKYARWTVCRCSAITLTGWDAYDDYAGHYTLDPRRLTTAQELAAILDGRLTFELRTSADGDTISRRDAHRIRAHAATAHRWPVLPEHRCGSTAPGRKLEPSDMKGK